MVCISRQYGSYEKILIIDFQHYLHIITEVLWKENNTLMREIAENTTSNLFASEVLWKNATEWKEKKEKLDSTWINSNNNVKNITPGLFKATKY